MIQWEYISKWKPIREDLFMKYFFLRFPGGKFKAVTLSYDDGVKDDIRFSEILGAHGMKATFNINSAYIGNEGKLTAREIQKYLLDPGHELAVHGERHMAPGIVTPARGMMDVLNCRLSLENTFGRIVRGMAYPDTGVTKMHNGNDYATVRSYLESAGIVYSRSLGGDNNTFRLPEDFLCWVPTAKHTNPKLFEWCDEFLAIDPQKLYITSTYPRLFYLWGHSFEFPRDNNWDVIERFCEKMGGREDTWYATNIEIWEYVHAFRSLVMSADCNRIYNPTLHTVWLTADEKDYCISPGETLVLAN